jgi:hypothetical protein
MAHEARDTIQCPHCGEGIKAAARICRHCRSAVATTGAPGVANGAPPNTSPRPSGVLSELRTFIVGRSLVEAAEFDPVLHAHLTADVTTILAALSDKGIITPVQVESISDTFRRHQIERAMRMLKLASERGLLLQAHADSALAAFEGDVLRRGVAEHLVTTKTMTAAQVASLDRPMAPEPRAAGNSERAAATESPEALAAAPRYIIFAVLFGAGMLFGVWWQGPKIISALVLGFVLLCVFVARRYPHAPEPVPAVAQLVARLPPLARGGFVSFALGSVASLALIAVYVSDALGVDREITLAELREAPRGAVAVGHMQIIDTHAVASALRYADGALTTNPLSVNRRTVLVSWSFRPEYAGVRPATFKFELVSPEGYVVENQRRLPARSFDDPDARRTEYLVFEVPWMEAARAPGAFRLRITREWLLLADHGGVHSVSIRLPQVEDFGARYLVDAANFNASTE